jgi:hypothetical protein
MGTVCSSSGGPAHPIYRYLSADPPKDRRRLRQLGKFWAFLCIFFCCSTALSQQPPNLPDVVGAAVPLYPPIARAANVQGRVVLRVTADGGRVQSTKVVSGPMLLSRVAESNLSTWQLVSMPSQTFVVTYTYKLSKRCKGKPSVSADFPRSITVCSAPRPPLYSLP